MSVNSPHTGVTPDMISVYTSEITIGAGLSYEIDLGGAGTLTSRVDYNYRSEIYAGPSTLRPRGSTVSDCSVRD